MDHAGGNTRRKPKLKHRFFVQSSRIQRSAGEKPVALLDDQTAHHLRTVLRLGAGALVTLFDNSGQEYEGEILESKPREVKVRILSSSTPRVESPIKITLAQAMIKGNDFDHALTLCTELGVSRLVPLFTARTVVKINKVEAADRVQRWQKICEEAAAQCGRVRTPLVEMPLEFKEFLDRKHTGLPIILWERGDRGQLTQILEDGKPEAIILLAGPEGGFEQAEVKKAMEAGFKIWGLGPRILRAEFAGAIALSILQFKLGDMG